MSLLWKIQKSRAQRTSYILGTMHVRSQDAYTPVTRAKHYMEQCRVYAGEMDLNDPDLDRVGESFLADQHLLAVLGAKKYDKYRRIVDKALGVNLDTIAAYQPMVITNMISEVILTQEYDMALDHFLWEYAESLDMHMMGLESAQDQFDIMQAIPYDLQLKGLKSAVKNVATFRASVLKLSELYKDGDTKTLYKKAKKSMGALRKLMIYDRNERMASRLAAACEEDAVFAAVGAAHLEGGKGILRLLKKRGFGVKPIATSTSH